MPVYSPSELETDGKKKGKSSIANRILEEELEDSWNGMNSSSG